MKISKKTFGILTDGRKVRLYTLKAGDLRLSITDFGAAWTSLIVPGKNGREDVLLGYTSLEGYMQNPVFFGSTVGRFANRIGNAAFSLDGKTYQLYKNDGNNTLHGGRRGFDKKLWNAFPYEDSDGVYVRFDLKSPDGEENFPGNAEVSVVYGVTVNNEITADYRVLLDRHCPVNITNHAYFNLAGEGSSDILSHELLLHASSYVECDSNHMPTGRIIPVKGTPFDFTASKPISAGYAAICGGDTSAIGSGYDHCFAVNEVQGGQGEFTLKPCAEVREPESSRFMRLSTTQPGVQFYTGNFLNGIPGKPGSVYSKNAGFCLETQHFPDSPNQSGFPSAIFGPGRPYHERTVFAFEW